MCVRVCVCMYESKEGEVRPGKEKEREGGEGGEGGGGGGEGGGGRAVNRKKMRG